jgi:hypothetical protein
VAPVNFARSPTGSPVIAARFSRGHRNHSAPIKRRTLVFERSSLGLEQVGAARVFERTAPRPHAEGEEREQYRASSVANKSGGLVF